MKLAKRYILLLLFFSTSFSLFANALKDSLQNVLKQTTDPTRRIELLLNILDLSDSDPDELTFARQLYSEAYQANDPLALSASLGTFAVNMMNAPERKDSLQNILEKANRILDHSEEEGLPEYYLMTGKARALQMASHDERAEICQQVQDEINSKMLSENKYQKASRLFLTGVIRYLLMSLTENISYKEATPYWEEAWDIVSTFPVATRKNFSGNIYMMLSFSYRMMGEKENFLKISDEYLKLLDAYYNQPVIQKRRPFIYKNTSYQICYQQLMLSHSLIGKSKAHEYYIQYCDFISKGKGDPFQHNKLYFYVFSQNYYGSLGENEKAIAFNDSILQLIESGQTRNVSYSTHYLTKARLLREMNRPEEACLVYDRAMHVVDSLVRKDQLETIGEMQVNNEVSELELEKATLNNRFIRIILYSTSGLLALAILFSIYFYVNLKRTKRLQQELIRQIEKSQESERMKSAFVKAVCKEVHAPLINIGYFTSEMSDESNSFEKQKTYSTIIQESCKQLTTSLDDMLETAYKESTSAE